MRGGTSWAPGIQSMSREGSEPLNVQKEFIRSIFSSPFPLSLLSVVTDSEWEQIKEKERSLKNLAWLSDARWQRTIYNLNFVTKFKLLLSFIFYFI